MLDSIMSRFDLILASYSFIAQMLYGITYSCIFFGKNKYVVSIYYWSERLSRSNQLLTSTVFQIEP